MKALMLTAYNHLEIAEVPLPEIGPDEVLVEVRACGICGSDVHGYDGSTGRRVPPLIMGHEASGVIAATGSNAGPWKPGDRVTFDSTEYCGECWHCRRGEVNLCDRRRVLGVSTGDYRRHGAFAEYVAVSGRALYRLPDAVTFPQAALVEPMAIALHAVGRAAPRLGDSALVVGTGVVGLFVVQLLRIAGSGTIIAVDVEETRLQMARRLGADLGLLAGDPGLNEAILKATGGRGADRAFEVVGIAAALGTAVAGVRKGGTVTLVGNLAPTVPLALQQVVTREVTLYGSCASSGEYPACLDLVARGNADVDALISAVAPLAEGPAWFERLHGGGPGLLKVVLEPA